MKLDSKHWTDPFVRIVLPFMERWALLILLTTAIIVILPGLGHSSLRDWDEAIYAQVAKEMIQSGDWIHLHHGYEPYFEKPPLLIWAIAFCYKLIGINELAARLPSAIAGILLVCVTYLCGRTLYGKWSGFLAALILLSSFGFVYHSRDGTTNLPLSLFIMTGVFAFQRLQNGSQRWWYLIAVSFGLAFMVKIWAGLVLPMAILLTILIDGKLQQTLRSSHFWLAVLLAGCIILPWNILMLRQYDTTFVDALVARNLIERSATPMEGHIGTSLYYLDVVRRFFSPWFFLTPFAFAMAIKEFVDGQRTSTILLSLIFTTLGIYSFIVNTKQQNYILPLLPAMAMLIAYLFVLATRVPSGNYFIFLVSAVMVATLASQNTILILSIFVIIALFMAIRTQLLASDQVPLIVTSVIFVMFVVTGTLNYLRANYRISTESVYSHRHSPVSQLASLAGKHNSSTTEPLLGYYRLEDEYDSDLTVQGPTANFYSNRAVIVAYSWEQLIEQMKAQGTGEMLVAEKYLELIPAEFNVTVVEKVYPLVYAKFCP